MSRSWVDTWKKCLLSVTLDDEQVLSGLSRAPHHPSVIKVKSEWVLRLLLNLDIGGEVSFHARNTATFDLK